jgi:hypothetical protein
MIGCNVKPAALVALITVALYGMPQSSTAAPLPQELAGKKRAQRLSPVSNWQLEMGDHVCRLSRRFDSPAGPGFVMFEQHYPGPRFDLTLAAPDFAAARKGAFLYGGMRSDLGMVTIDALEFGMVGYAEAMTISEVRLDSGTNTDGKKHSFETAQIDASYVNQVERIVIQRSGTISSFELGKMHDAFNALNACTMDLLTSWGLDGQKHVEFNGARMPQASVYFARLSHFLANSPGNEGNQSLLRIRALVAKDGSVSDCYHEYVFSSGGLKPDVCQDIRAMRFEPATDASGMPMDSFWARSIKLSRYGAWNADASGGSWGDRYK